MSIRSSFRLIPALTSSRLSRGSFRISSATIRRMSDQKPITAYEALKSIPAQSQENLPGTDAAMKSDALFTQVECFDNDGKPYLREYVGTNKLKGKSALITGGDSGIGRAAAQCFAREGADITIVYLKEEEVDAQNVKKAIEADGRKCLLLPLDIMDEKNCKKAVEAHVAEHGGLNILVNNASKQIMTEKYEEINLENVESTFRSNVLGMFALTKFAVPHLKRGSAIINTTSVTAFKGSPQLTDYSSTKGAIVSYTRSLALHLAPKGIRVNAVAPGPFLTPLQPASRSAENMEDWTVGSTPLHGRAGMPAELGPSYVFLADSGSSNTMTGQILHLNLGQWVG